MRNAEQRDVGENLKTLEKLLLLVLLVGVGFGGGFGMAGRAAEALGGRG